MNTRGSRQLLFAAAAGAMAVVSFHALAQVPAGGPPRGAPGMGMMGPADKASTIERMGLNDAALKLGAEQKAQIEKITGDYIAEQQALAEKYPMAPGNPPSEEGMRARRDAREQYTAAIGKVLDDEQRKTWQAAQAARRPPMGPPGGGPPR